MINFTPILRAYSSIRFSFINSYNPKKVQEQQLLSLLNKASNTKFGVDHKFLSIKNASDYQKAVPLRKYEAFWNEYWKDNFPVLNNVSWPGTIPYFAVSSGTSSGTTKFIPYTDEMAKSNTKASFDILVYHTRARPNSKVMGGKSFILGGSTDLIEQSPGIFSGDLSGISVIKAPSWTSYFLFPPKNLALLKNWEEKLEVIGSASLSENIRMISGVPSWMLLLFSRVIEKSGGKELHEIYPDLELIVHGGVKFDPYKKQFEDLFKNSHSELREVYPASEGFIAIADRGYDEGLRLNLDNGIFYEFIPVDELDSPNPTRHWVGNAEVGVNYAVALTTCAGLWSYILGDTVRFVDLDPPRILVTGRTSYSMSAFGEHLIEEEVQKSISKAADLIHASVIDYSMGAKFPETPDDLGFHIYIVEFDTDVTSEQILTFTSELDQNLIKLNEDYEAHRSGGIGMKEPQVIAVQKGTFNGWMKKRGKLGGQNKVPRMINDQDLLKDLIDFVGA